MTTAARIERLLAAYFDIDLDRAAQERHAVYEAVAARANRAKKGDGC